MTRTIVPLVLLVALTACSRRETQTFNYTVRPAPSANRNATLDTAEAVLVSMGYAIAKRDDQRGILTTEPIRAEREIERSIRADNPHRKFVEVRVTGPETEPKVQCKVVVQEQSDESFRMFVVDQRGDDVPGHNTAIDRDAATTAEQNAVWRTVLRDKSAEREILNRILETDAAP